MSTANLPISSEAVPNRVVIRCKGCRLNQFLTRNGLCRKCRHELIEKPKEEIKPVIVEVWRPVSLAAQIPLAVRLLRFAMEFKQKDLALRMGCPRTFITKIESGKKSSTLKTVRSLARAFGMDTCGLIAIAERLA
jgi:DNA-binding XRE family transcriptional regulator